jgi:hypothetical protein
MRSWIANRSNNVFSKSRFAWILFEAIWTMNLQYNLNDDRQCTDDHRWDCIGDSSSKLPRRWSKQKNLEAIRQSLDITMESLGIQ